MYYQNQKLDAVNLLLGNACNRRCSYCLQDSYWLTKKADFATFSANISELVTSKGLTTNTVHYWGGEPLLYRDRLFGSVDLFDRLFPTCRLHRITTNGTLVDEEYVDFCNSNPKIHTVVSFHDFEIDKENWKQIGRLNSVSVSGVVNKQRPSPRSYYEDWKRACEYGQREFHVGLYPIHATDGATSETWLTKEDVDNFFLELLPYLYGGMDAYIRSIVDNFYFATQKGFGFNLAPKCFNEDILSIDMFGNQYVCHHNNSIEASVGNVFNNQKFIPLKEQRFDQYFNSKECQECEALGSCHGGCYLTNTHDVECYWNKTQFLFYKLTKELRI